MTERTKHPGTCTSTATSNVAHKPSWREKIHPTTRDLAKSTHEVRNVPAHHVETVVKTDARKDAAARQLYLMSLRGMGKSIQSDGAPVPNSDAPPHPLDEFPTGYSSVGCSPALPTSASPVAGQYAVFLSCTSRGGPAATSKQESAVSKKGKYSDDPMIQILTKTLFLFDRSHPLRK
jgi:hypothetical protein